jgi:hypothetical protein
MSTASVPFPLRRTLWALALAAAGSTPALAQQMGTYQGTTSEGGSITISIGDDGAGGLAYTGNTTFWAVNCKSGDLKNFAWGIGAGQPFTGKKVTAEARFDILYEKLTMKFNGPGTVVTGTFFGSGPTFTDVNTSTTKVEYCSSNTLTYTANYVAGSAAVRPAAPGSAVRLAP